MKTVSVVMATYNGEKYIREQIESIVNQTYPVYELIIQDDGSTDHTVEILREYEQHYPFVHVYQNERNLGYQENFRIATLHATGDFIALSDQDDVWFPKKLELQVQAIGANAACYSQHLRGNDMEHARLVDYKCAPERQMFAAVVGHSLLMQRSFAQDPANWLDYMTYDKGLSALAHFKGGLTHVAEPLNWHRSHEESVTIKIYNQMFDDSTHPTWQPYVFGFTNYRKLQQKESWKKFYTLLLQQSLTAENKLVTELCQCLLTDSPFALLRLCFLCMKHRKTVYPGKIQGFKGIIRGFCFPLIHSYHCTFYD